MAANVKGIAQFTIRDENDITIGTTAPASPVKDQMWLDTSSKPSVLKRYNGSAWDVVNETTVGGRNLIKNSNFYNGSTNWSLASVSIVDTTFKFNSHNTLKINKSGFSSDNWNGAQQTLACDCSQGKTYTASFYYYVDDSSVLDYSFAFEMKGKTSSGDVNICSYPTITAATAITKKWTKISYTFTISRSDLTAIFAYPRIRRNGIVWFTDFKLEEGNTPTDWTPAPEDVDSSITSVKTVTESNTTSINTIQGQISTLISNTTITKTDGTTTQLKDAYNSTVNTINSMQTTIAEHTSDIDANTNSIASVTAKAATLEANLNSISASLSSTQSTVSTHTTQINSVTSTANTALNSINNLTIGGRNLIKNFNTKMSCNIYNSGAATVNFVADSTTASGYRYDVIITALGTDGRFNCFFSPSYSSLYTRGNGNQYTISFKVKSTVARTWSMRCEANNASETIGVTTNYQTVSITGNSTLNYQALYVFNNTNVVQVGDIISFCDIKLEEGNQATTWTPAPEDVDSSIASVNTNANTAISTANAASSTATTASNNANSAVTTANTASSNASNAVTTANAASTSASTALTNANNAVSTANSSNTTANTANTTANSALSAANTATSNVANLTTTVSTTISRVSSLELTASSLTTRVGNTETAISSLQIGGRNLIRLSYIVNRGCSSFSYDSSSNTWTCVSPKGSSSWGYGFYISSGGKIPVERGKTFLISLEVNPSVDCTWNADVNNSYTGNTGGNDNDDTTKRQNSSHALPANTWTKCWFSYTAKSNVSYDLFDSSSNWGIVTTSLDNDVSFKFRNVKGEYGNTPTDWTPAPEDVDSSIAAVKDYATTTITSNVATINQTTTSIQAQVTSLQSSVSTINTTLGNKADTTTVTSVTNRVSTLESSVTGINASITTLNSNVSSVTTTANNALSAINSLSIGGRNLLLNSNFATKDYSKWSIWGTCTTRTVIAVNNKNYIHLAQNDTSTYRGLNQTVNNIKTNYQYTISYTAYSNGSSYSMTVGFHQKSSSTIVAQTRFSDTLTTTATRYTHTFTTTTSTIDNFNLMIGNTGSVFDIYITDIKLEEGNKATTWTPAPEDVDSQITTINSSVSSLQSSVSVLQSQIALKVEQSNIDSAITTVNGRIDSTNATISSMQSSINLQLNSITSSVSTKVGSVNLVKNSSFEDTNAFSVSSIAGTPTKCSIVKYATEASLVRFTDSALSTNIFTIQKMSGAISLTDVYAYTNLYVDVTPGKTYTISYYHAERGEISSFSSYIRTLNSSGNEVSHVIINPSAMSTTAWSRYSMSWTCPTGVYKIQFRFGFICTNSAWMLIDNVQVEEGTTLSTWTASTIDVVGTLVTQTPTSVMTAFNGISKYFQVNANGATFGDTSTGDYTLLGSNGLKHHVGGTEYDYMYITYLQDSTFNIIDKTYTVPLSDENNFQNDFYTIPYDNTLKAMLNGKTPKYVFFMIHKTLTYPTKPSNWDWDYTDDAFATSMTPFNYGASWETSWDANGITIYGHSLIYTGFTGSNVRTVLSGGTVKARFLIFA